MAHPGQPPGKPAAPAQAKGQPPGAQRKPGPPDAAVRSPDDQLDALLRQYDEAIEANRKAARGAMKAAGQRARFESFRGTIQGINGRMLELATRNPRTNAAEQALVWLVTNRGLEPEAKRAWELLGRDYVRSDRLKQVFSQRLEVLWASQAVEDPLRNASEQNPYREVRGLARPPRRPPIGSPSSDSSPRPSRGSRSPCRAS